MTPRTQRRWALFVLLVWMPAYIILVLVGMGWLSDRFGRPPVLAELVIYVCLGLLWVAPFRRVFLGVGKAPS
ncbi:DUF2842 domain-containing protein [Paracoccus suum]|uniref:DUF2842 domain-containing protein n=1 Tax=Paracoccus suum TaxID=2259340 RepID=UPI001F545906|nr:DUF2842 domain-containing protein [Paracoccus suum]